MILHPEKKTHTIPIPDRKNYWKKK